MSNASGRTLIQALYLMLFLCDYFNVNSLEIVSKFSSFYVLPVSSLIIPIRLRNRQNLNPEDLFLFFPTVDVQASLECSVFCNLIVQY